MNCNDCEYIADGKQPSRALRLHRLRMHSSDKFGQATVRAKSKFGPLIEATGNWKNAIEAGDLLHIWPNDVKPTTDTLRTWADEWEDGKEHGIASHLDARVHTARQQLRAAREYAAWKMVSTYAEAGIAVGEGIRDGKEYSHVEPKYLADGVSMMLREISSAFGTPRATPTQIGKFVLNIGDRPAPKKFKAVETPSLESPAIEAEFKEMAS